MKKGDIIKWLACGMLTIVLGASGNNTRMLIANDEKCRDRDTLQDKERHDAILTGQKQQAEIKVLIAQLAVELKHIRQNGTN